MQYNDPKEASLAKAELAREQNRVEELPALIVSVALYEESYERAAAYCLALVEHPNANVRGNAILGLGHLARRFGRLPEAARLAISAGLSDSEEYVRGQASSAADDVRFFIGWKLPNNPL
jgi:hypothetical protein